MRLDILTKTHISSKKCENYIVSKLNRLKGLNEKCENILSLLSQDQIRLPKLHVFSKKNKNHIVSKPTGPNRLNKKCEKIYYFKVNPAHPFRNQNVLLSIFNSQTTIF